MDYGAALAFLDEHVNLEALIAATRATPPTLDRIAALMDLMGQPQRQYAVLHLTGTNGKTSTARMLTRILMTKGLSVGTFTSPDLHRVNERLAWNEEPITDEAFAEIINALASLESLMDERPSRFDLLTAAAFRWFADVAVDAAVVEVGLGGRWDATNVADGEVAVITSIGLDHTEFLGPTRRHVAGEKVGIVKPGSTLVLGEVDDEVRDILEGTPAAITWERERDFACLENRPAHLGRLLTLRTPTTEYEDVFLPLHGAHQGNNAVTALTAAEAFFGAPLERDVVAEAFAEVTSPGRLEVVGRRPLTILDGVKNPEGAAAAAAALAEEFSVVSQRVIVVGLLRGRDPAEVLQALDVGGAARVITCPAPSPRTVPPDELAAVARLLGAAAETAPSVAEAVARGLAAAGPDDLLFITGSQYVVGAARGLLVS
ncbi:MAG: bifunctional folylpolyglutamate synthase/dihydrofolate synthase [Actinobacteria bacterium]|nr:bifunctional folylpolyglutamate synthase/dihydrofolate synthase [Actinomycetota bacterium]